MEYGLYLAIVVEVATTDNRVRVKIIPEMGDIANNDCPLWPFFFRDEFLMPSIGDMVWVLCDNEFSAGYILGAANYTTYQDESFTPYSIPERLKDLINKTYVELKSSKFEFADLKVTFWNKDCIHFVERSTGGVIYAFSNGTLYIFRPEEFRVHIKGNSIKLDKGSFGITAGAIKLQSEDVALGNNPTKNVMTTMGDEGAAPQPSKYVKA